MFELGNSLREARLRQGLEFSQLEQATKIRAKYLRALEAEEFDQLPSQTYVKGFLRSYADYLGLEGQLYVDEYNSRFVAADDELRLRPHRTSTRPPRVREHRRVERNVLVLALVAIALVTALIIAAWKFGGTSTTSIPNLRTKPAKKHQARAKHSAGPTKAKVARLLVHAVRGNSFLQVRRGSATGPPLYQGTLERGQSQVFAKTRLWLNIGTPTNLRMRLNGRPITVGGNAPRVLIVTAKSIHAAAPGT